MRPEFSGMFDAAHELLDAWDTGVLSSTEASRRFSLLRLEDTSGVEWTLGSSSLSWYCRTSGEPWVSCPPPDTSVVAATCHPDVLSDLADRITHAPPTGPGNVVVESSSHVVDAPLTPEGRVPFGDLETLPPQAQYASALHQVATGVWEGQNDFAPVTRDEPESGGSVAFSWGHGPNERFSDIEGVADDDLLRRVLGE